MEIKILTPEQKEELRIENAIISNELINRLTTIQCLCESNNKLNKLKQIIFDLYKELNNEKPLYNAKFEIEFMAKRIENIKNIRNRSLVIKNYPKVLKFLGKDNPLDTKSHKIAREQFRKALDDIEIHTPESSLLQK